MPRNGSGTFTLPAGNPVNTGTTISSTWANTTLTDIGSALTTSISSDGQTTPTASLPMGGFIHTGVGNATVRTNYPSAGQVQDGALMYLGSVAGTDTITASAALGMTAYTVGQTFRFISAGANTTTAVTININGIGAKNLNKNGATALAVGDIISGAIVQIVYDGTQFQVTGVTTLADASVSTAKIQDSAVTTAKIQDNAVTTAKIQDSAVTTAKIQDNAVTTAKIANASITPAKLANSGYELGMRNRIINGAMQIWQRGTSQALTASWAYGSADRYGFIQTGTANGVAVQTASGLAGFQYAVKLGRNNAAVTTGPIYLNTVLETFNSIDLAGQAVTLSFWAKAGANFSGISSSIGVQIFSGTGTDQAMSNVGAWTGQAYPVNVNQVITTTWTRYIFTGTVASNATQVGIIINFTPTGTAGADDNVYITGIQLEKGSTATPFDYRPYGTELALCQRYFWIQKETLNNSYMVGYFITATLFRSNFTFPVTLRASPTFSSSAANTFFVQNFIANSSLSALSIVSSSPYSAYVLANVSISASGGQGGALIDSTGSFISFSAEL